MVENLTWSLITRSVTKKTQQRLNFLQSLRKAHLPPPTFHKAYGEHPEQLHHCLEWKLHTGYWIARPYCGQLRRVSESHFTQSQIFIVHAASTRLEALWKTPCTPHTNTSPSSHLPLLPDCATVSSSQAIRFLNTCQYPRKRCTI